MRLTVGACQVSHMKFRHARHMGQSSCACFSKRKANSLGFFPCICSSAVFLTLVYLLLDNSFMLVVDMMPRVSK